MYSCARKWSCRGAGSPSRPWAAAWPAPPVEAEAALAARTGAPLLFALLWPESEGEGRGPS
eukprot:11918228-Alexandrium_andersonii.AAC.1